MCVLVTLGLGEGYRVSSNLNWWLDHVLRMHADCLLLCMSLSVAGTGYETRKDCRCLFKGKKCKPQLVNWLVQIQLNCQLDSRKIHPHDN